MTEKIMGTLKAWTGLVGAALTAWAGIGGAPQWVVVTAAVLTAIAVYEIPNKPAA